MVQAEIPPLVSAIWERFVESGEWPTVQRIQSDLPEHDVRLVARQTGSDLVDCGWRSEEHCRLELRAIALCEGSGELIEDFLGAVRYFARKYVEDQAPSISSDQLATALDLNEKRHRQLLLVLWVQHAGMSVEGNIQSLEYKVSLTPSIVFFHETTTLEDYFEGVTKASAEESEAVRREYPVPLRRTMAPVVATPSPLENPPKLGDPRLSKMLHEDLEELLLLRSTRAWKAAALLAGSCIEAALLDMWMSRPNEAVESLGKGWRNKSAYEMAQAAAGRGWVDQDHIPLLDFIREWRNTIHPAKALERRPPNKQLAEMLIALLDYLLQVLHGNATRDQL